MVGPAILPPPGALVRRRLVIEVDEDGRVAVAKEGGIFFSTGRPLRLMNGRLTLHFDGSEVIQEVVADALGLQPVTDREQALAGALLFLAANQGPEEAATVIDMLRAAGLSS